MNTLKLNPSLSLPQLYFCPGEQIPCPPQVIYLCTRGVVLVTTCHAGGEEGVLGLMTPGLPFGVPLSGAHPYIATALTQTRLHKINFADLNRSPQLVHQFLPYLLERLRYNEEFLAVTNQRRVQERFVALLILLAKRTGHRTEQGIALDIRLTHQQIASAINATRVTVTRLMGRCRELGLILDHPRHMLICNLEKLESYLERA